MAKRTYQDVQLCHVDEIGRWHEQLGMEGTQEEIQASIEYYANNGHLYVIVEGRTPVYWSKVGGKVQKFVGKAGQQQMQTALESEGRWIN